MQHEQIDATDTRAVVWDCACGERHSRIEFGSQGREETAGCSCGRVYAISWSYIGNNLPTIVTLVSRKGRNPIEQKQFMINSWLRHHPDYQVQLRFCSIYGCAEIEVTHGKERIHISWGDTLEKRIDEVLRFLELDGNVKEGK